MARRIRVGVQVGDIARLDADVVALKFSGALFGATGKVANALGISESEMRRSLPSIGALHLVPGNGRIGARHAAFLNVAPMAAFTHDHIRQFSVDVLHGLGTRLPDARHVGLTLHAVGLEMDLNRSLRAELEGCSAAVRAGGCPGRLDRITIVNRDAGDVQRLQGILLDALPDGAIEAPDVERAAAVHDRAAAAPAFDVFISFKSGDASYARDVFEFLTSNGLRTFFSRESLPQLGSDEYHAQIDRAIERTRHMVLVTSSREHAESQWVEYEWRLFLGERLAGRKSGNLLTVIAGEMRIEDLPIGLRNREVLRCDPAEFPRLLEYVRSPAQAVATLANLVVATAGVLKAASWEQALDRMPDLSIDGHRGWRLPTLEELRLIREASLLPDRSCYWSGQEAGDDEAFYMHFDDGHVGRGPKSFSSGLSAVFVRTIGS